MPEDKTVHRKVVLHSAGPANLPEDQLLERAKQGDLDAFGILVKPYLGKLSKCIWNITKNREDTEDSMQEALLRAFSYLSQFKGTARFSTWLISIGVNQALMCLRSRRWKMVSLDASDENGNPSPALHVPETRPNPEQQYRNVELAKSLHRAIHTLPSKCRTVFELRYVHELSNEQAALALNISIAAVKTRALRARRHLEKRLAYW